MAIVFDESTAKALQWLMQIQKDQGEDGIKRLMSGIGSLKSLNSSSIATSEKSFFTGREQSPPTPVESVQGNSEAKVIDTEYFSDFEEIAKSGLRNNIRGARNEDFSDRSGEEGEREEEEEEENDEEDDEEQDKDEEERVNLSSRRKGKSLIGSGSAEDGLGKHTGTSPNVIQDKERVRSLYGSF